MNMIVSYVKTLLSLCTYFKTFNKCCSCKINVKFNYFHDNKSEDSFHKLYNHIKHNHACTNNTSKKFVQMYKSISKTLILWNLKAAWPLTFKNNDMTFKNQHYFSSHFTIPMIKNVVFLLAMYMAINYHIVMTS